jgi:predicted nucleic acid-binding protein
MNVLVDSSVWIDHLHRSDTGLVVLLQASEVVMHPVVLGELACGTLPNRREFRFGRHYLPQQKCRLRKLYGR